MYQMKEAILCKYGEVILKGTNKKTFENQLMNEVRRRAALVGDYTVRYNQRPSTSNRTTKKRKTCST